MNYKGSTIIRDKEWIMQLKRLGKLKTIEKMKTIYYINLKLLCQKVDFKWVNT